MMRKAIRLMLLLGFACGAAELRQTEQIRSQIENHVIRLHILADSDATADQMHKLAVRDALLETEWIPSGADYETGCGILRQQLPAIQKTAEEALRQNGCMDSVRVSLEQTAFPARTYGNATLPAGDYQALRVEIGSAAGQNWWCVMYPAMCVPAAAEPALCLPDEKERDLVLHPEAYEVRLKCLDAARAAFKWAKTKMQSAASA